MGEVIAVLSGKGGTGKTSVCAGLATSLAADGLRVLCVDCNMGLPSLDISLGITHLAPLSFQDVMGGADLKNLPPHPGFSSLRFLAAPANRSVEQVDHSAFSQLLDRAKQQYDYVFLDGSAGLDAGFRLAAAKADRILVVTGMDPGAVRAAGRIGQALELMGKRDVRLIVNRIDLKLAQTMGMTVDDVMDEAGLPLIGVVPADSNVAVAASQGRPLLLQTQKGAAAACKRIALRLQGKHQSIPAKLI